jgi:hypothetical protein
VAGALQHSKVYTPRTDGLAVLVGQNSGDLVQMSQVMNGPGGQQLRQSNRSKGRMPSTPLEVLWPEIQRAQFGQIL